jgi:hypothetical protein
LEYIDAIRLCALLDVVEGDDAYQKRRLTRWYSQTFHTSLPVVEDLDFEDILQAWFETDFESMSAEKRAEKAVLLTETPKERKDREEKAEREERAEAEFAKNIPKLLANVPRAKPPEDLPQVGDAVPVSDKPLIPNEVLQKLAEVPEIRMTFTDENLDDEALLDSMVLPPPNKD